MKRSNKLFVYIVMWAENFQGSTSNLSLISFPNARLSKNCLEVTAIYAVFSYIFEYGIIYP